METLERFWEKVVEATIDRPPPAGQCRRTTGPYYVPCEKPATRQLCGSDGRPLVGYVYCDEHAAEVADVYCGVLGWGWTMDPIEEEQ